MLNLPSLFFVSKLLSVCTVLLNKLCSNYKHNNMIKQIDTDNKIIVVAK